jgi:hypothetical protein
MKLYDPHEGGAALWGVWGVCEIRNTHHARASATFRAAPFYLQKNRKKGIDRWALSLYAASGAKFQLIGFQSDLLPRHPQDLLDGGFSTQQFLDSVFPECHHSFQFGLRFNRFDVRICTGHALELWAVWEHLKNAGSAEIAGVSATLASLAAI